MVASKSARSNKWFCRIDGDVESLRKSCNVLVKQLDVVCMLAAFHVGKTGENAHCHIVIETNNIIQKQSYANNLKNVFVIPKKDNYALDIWDGVKDMGATSYLFHEPNEVILVNKGFSDAELESARRANDAVQRVIAINKEKASNKLVEKLYEKFKGVENPDRVEMLAYMLREIKEGNNYHPGEYTLKKYVEEVEVRLCPDDKLYAHASSMCARLWKSF